MQVVVDILYYQSACKTNIFNGKVLWCCRVNCDLRNTFREYMLVFTTITYQ